MVKISEQFISKYFGQNDIKFDILSKFKRRTKIFNYSSKLPLKYYFRLYNLNVPN